MPRWLVALALFAVVVFLLNALHLVTIHGSISL
jgi:hypothetical protein